MDYYDLEVWKRSHTLTLAIYEICGKFPDDERYGLTNQLKRSVASIPTNIAEGKSQFSRKVYSRHINIAAASAGETSYQLRLAKDLNYLDTPIYSTLLKEVSTIRYMLGALYKRLEGEEVK